MANKCPLQKKHFATQMGHWNRPRTTQVPEKCNEQRYTIENRVKN
jgi:hypothetical protein